jgi:hypothetical protein
MTTYDEEMDRHRKKLARPLYPELRALGLGLSAEEEPTDPTGYRVSVGGLRSLSPAQADRMRQRVQEGKSGLLRVLLSRRDLDLEAIRREGVA